MERYDFYIPVTEPGGPGVHLLDNKRFTLLHYQDGTTSERLDSWRGRYDTPPTSDKPWAGATTFTEKPGLQLPDYTTTEGRSARELAAPTEPTPQERALHELTHIPYRAWCSHCARAKAKKKRLTCCCGQTTCHPTGLRLHAHC